MNFNLRYKILFFFFTFIWLSNNAIAQGGLISGKVRDTETGKPLMGVNLMLIESKISTTTNGLGNYKLVKVKPGDYTLKVSNMGYVEKYRKVKVTKHSVSRLSFWIMPVRENFSAEITTANRSQRSAVEITSQFDVISKIEKDNYVSRTLDDLLRENLIASQTTMRQDNMLFSVRGVNKRSLCSFIIDGVPINNFNQNFVDWSLLSPQQIEKIEVVKGNYSALYGSGAIGEVVHLKTKKPEKAFGTEIHSFYGNQNNIGGSINLSGIVKNKRHATYWLASTYYEQKNLSETQFPTQETQSNLLKSFDVNALIKFGINFTKSNFEIAYLRSEKRIGLKFSRNKLTMDSTKLLNDLVSIKYNWKFRSWTFFNTIFFRQQYLQLQKSDTFLIDKQIPRYWNEKKYLDYGIDITGEKNLIGTQVLITGVTVRFGNERQVLDYVNFKDNISNRYSSFNTAIFGGYELKLFHNRLNFNANARLDFVRNYHGSQIIENPTLVSGVSNRLTKQFLSDNFQPLSYRFAIQYYTTHSIQSFFVISGGFQSPRFEDFMLTRREGNRFIKTNSRLQPIETKSLELGAKSNFSEKYFVNTSLYASYSTRYPYLRKTLDSIELEENKWLTIYQPQNLADVISYGIEGRINIYFNRFLSIKTFYNFNYSRYNKFVLSDTSSISLKNKYLINIPNHNASLFFLWENRFFHSALSANYIGRYWLDDYNTAKGGTYITADFKLSRWLRKHVYVAVSVQNMFDTRLIKTQQNPTQNKFILYELAVKF